VTVEDAVRIAVERDVRGSAGAGLDLALAQHGGERAQLGDLWIAVAMEDLDPEGFSRRRPSSLPPAISATASATATT